MLTVVAINPWTVTITVSHPKFAEDLQRMTNEIPASQRKFSGRKWTVVGADKLIVPYIQNALSELELQGRMF